MSEPAKEPDTSQHGTTHGYRVEAMVDSDDPLTVDGQTFTRKWRFVHYAEGAVGVPIGPRFERHWLAASHTYDYAAAQALRWWLHANANAAMGILGFGAMSLHTRLVKYRIKYDIEATRDSDHAEINGRDKD